MNISKIENASGKLQSISSMKQTKKDGRWSIGLLISDVWYNLFGNEETLNRTIAELEKGNDVNVKFKTKGQFRELLEVKPIGQGKLQSPASNDCLIPISQTWTAINDDGTLNTKRLQYALKLIESDCVFLRKEIDKVGQAKEESHSH